MVPTQNLRPKFVLSPKFPRRLSKKNFCDTLNVLFVVVWKRDLSRERSAAGCTLQDDVRLDVPKNSDEATSRLKIKKICLKIIV